ncbi:hypothetical protein PMAYCL1PPCAC_25526, partial [Pristionchus mayeri]
KTTVAAAIAAEIGRDTVLGYRSKKKGRSTTREAYYSSVQLLLSVQNVAVDNMGAVLKKLDFGGGDVYNMKSAKKLNLRDPAPYDFFDLISEAELHRWKTGDIFRNTAVNDKQQRYGHQEKERKKQNAQEECITHHRREFEKTIVPKMENPPCSG